MTSIRIEVVSPHMGDFTFEEEIHIPPMVMGITDNQIRMHLTTALARVIDRAYEAYGLDKLERL